MRNVSNQFVEKNQNKHFVFIDFFHKRVPFMRQCGKCGAARRATNDVTIWRIRVAY
jgi:hypothetical protein